MGPKPSIDPERTPVVRKITSHLDKRLLVPYLAVLARRLSLYDWMPY